MGKITLLDGACGTFLWDMAEKNGVAKDPVWKFNIDHPEFVSELHRRYIAAGCDAIQTNTFDANRLSVARSSDASVDRIISAAAELALREAAGSGVGVYATFGPLALLPEPYGTLTRAETASIYAEMVRSAAAAGVDFIVLETFMDIEMLRIAAEEALKTGLPVLCSMTFTKKHRTMMGDSVRKIVDTLTPLGVSAVGINCSFGPADALEVLREFSSATLLPLYFKPNSGMGDICTAEQFAKEVSAAFPLASYVGGCCGCDDSYIRALKKLL